MVYRKGFVGDVASIVGDAVDNGMTVKLWALEAIAPGLERWTIGTGPGARFDLLNRCTAADPDQWLVHADDDVGFAVGSLTTFVRAAQRWQFDFAQPAHARTSHISFRITRRQPLTVARETTFVEQGPVVAFSPAARRLAEPFHPGAGMAWGIELEWMEARRFGLTMGVIDAVRIVHRLRAGSSYDTSAERERMTAALEEKDIADWSDVQQSRRRWILPPRRS